MIKMRVKIEENVRAYSVYRTMIRAMREQRPVFVRYTRENGSHTSRTIEPLAITRNAAGDRYVRVLDWKSGDRRTFRLDRIDAYGVGPAFGFRLATEDDVVMSDEDRKAYAEWAERQYQEFVDHASTNPQFQEPVTA